MSLRSKIILVSILILLLFSLLIYLSSLFISQELINKSLKGRTKEYKENLSAFLQKQKEDLKKHVIDYAFWEEMGEKGVIKKDKNWIRDNLEPWVRNTFNYELVALLDEKGNVIVKSPFEEIPFKDLLPKKLEIESNFYITNNGIIYYSISPVFDNSGKKYFHAFLIFGKFIDNSLLGKWEDLLGYSIALRSKDFLFYSNPKISSLCSFFEDDIFYKNDYLCSALTVSAKNGEFQVIIMKYDDLPNQIRSSLQRIFGISLFFILIFSVVLNSVIISKIVNPLREFQKIAEKISLGNYSIDLDLKRKDEIGKLAESFKRMTEKISEREKALILAKKLAEDSSLRDELTGIFNRRFLYKYTEELIKNQKNFALIFIDLDDFKIINDILGHSIGDEVLIRVSQWFSNNLRGEDKVIRYGGDEFCLIFHNVNKNIIEKVMKRIYLRFLEENFVKNLNLGFSYGIAVYPEDGDNLDKLLAKADEEMYKMKKT